MKTIHLLVKQLRYFMAAGLVFTSLAMLPSCSSDNKNESRTEDALENTGDAIEADTKEATAEAREDAREAGDKIEAKTDAAAADFREERDKAVANMKEQQRKLDAKIDDLQAKMKREGREAKADAREELAELKQERDELGQDLRKAQDATADAWQEIKKGFKRAGDRLDNDKN
jgi:small-conductance mechanosensitive channel